MRPIHCLDISRDKFVYKTDGDWSIDLSGEQIMKPAMAHMRTLYDISENNTDMVDRLKNQRLLLDMDMNATKKTMNNLKKLTLLKNNN